MISCSSCGRLSEPYHGRRCRSCVLKAKAVYYRANRGRLDARHKQWHEDQSARSKAGAAWRAVVSRAENKDGKHPTYARVENRLKRDVFIDWYCQNYFPGCSVDRIDNTGHYELGNLQMLTLAENSAKQGKNYLAPEGQHWCSTCKSYLPADSFHRLSRGSHGLQSSCKVCRKRHR